MLNLFTAFFLFVVAAFLHRPDLPIWWINLLWFLTGVNFTLGIQWDLKKGVN